MSVYYTFLEFSTWLLQRAEGWFVFGTLKSKEMEEMAHGASELFARILKVFFTQGVANLKSGCMYVYRGSHKIYKGDFAGILGDEKRLKEFFDIKGHAGWK